MTFSQAQSVVQEGLDVRAFPAAVCEVGRRSGPLWTESFGALTYAADAPPATAATIFDLASLTKVIASTSLVLRLVKAGQLAIDTRVADVVSGWRGKDRVGVTLRHLLDHSSGLPAQLPLTSSPCSRQQALAALMQLPLDRVPGVVSVYSDAGFILLGLVLEHAMQRRLDDLWEESWATRPDADCDGASLAYLPDVKLVPQIAPTEFAAERGGLLQGRVHDEAAEALGGVAAHAGLFGTASAVGTFAAWVLRSFTEDTWLASPTLMHTFATRTGVPGSSRALGWDTMLPTSSCGSRMSATAIGHTGFTGTSLWVDWERDLYAVLLTNRVHPTRGNQRFLPLRARFHDAVLDAFGAASR